MLDVPQLGMDLLNRTITRVAEVSEDSTEFDQSYTILETLKKLVQPGEVKLALTAVSRSHVDLIRREREIVQSAVEVETVRGW